MKKFKKKHIKSLSETIDGISQQAFRDYGFARTNIITKWPEIVGQHLAYNSLPEKLTQGRHNRGGTLYIRVNGSLATDIKQQEKNIIDRINSFYGYCAVDRILLRHGPIPSSKQIKPYIVAELSPEEQSQLKEQLNPIKNKGLREALFELGHQIKSHSLQNDQKLDSNHNSPSQPSSNDDKDIDEKNNKSSFFSNRGRNNHRSSRMKFKQRKTEYRKKI